MLKARDFRKIAKESLKGKWLLAAGAGFIAALLGGNLIGGATSSIEISEEIELSVEQFMYEIALSPVIVNLLMGAIGIVAALLAIYGVVRFIIGGVVSLGYAKFNLNLVNHNNPKIEDVFSQFHNFGKGFIMNFLRSLYTLLWTFLFIIPGIIASYSYAMTPYILYENPDMTANEAIKASKELMRGNKWRLFCMEFSFIGWSILCVFTFGIGYLFLHPYTEAAGAAFYREIKWEKMKKQAGME